LRIGSRQGPGKPSIRPTTSDFAKSQQGLLQGYSGNGEKKGSRQFFESGPTQKGGKNATVRAGAGTGQTGTSSRVKRAGEVKKKNTLGRFPQLPPAMSPRLKKYRIESIRLACGRLRTM